MNESYFSDRERGAPLPLVREEIDTTTWGGVVALIEQYITKLNFSEDYGACCQDQQQQIVGTHYSALSRAANAEVRGIKWRQWMNGLDPVPATPSLLVLLVPLFLFYLFLFVPTCFKTPRLAAADCHYRISRR